MITGTVPFVSADTNFDVTVRVSDGTDSVTQSYVLTVKNVVGNGGGREKSGGTGTRVISDQEFETQKYLGQFAPKTIALEEEGPKAVKKNLFGIFLILFALLCLALLIILIVLLISRSG